MAPMSQEVPKESKEFKEEAEEKKLPQAVPPHHFECNQEWYPRKKVEESQKEFPWKVTECYNNQPWISWEVLGMEVKSDKYKLRWKNSCDMSHAWTGLVRLLPGQVELMHTHTTPMIYYILQGKPIVNLNWINNRTSKWQCVSIPSECPHGITNDTEEEVVIAWCYLSLDDKPAPDKNYNWKFLEDPFAD